MCKIIHSACSLCVDMGVLEQSCSLGVAMGSFGEIITIVIKSSMSHADAE